MTTTVFRHTDDDGELSMFVSGNEVLFVCTMGHWWVVDTTSSGTITKGAAKKAAAGDEITENMVKAARSAAELENEFGSEALRAMKFK